MKRVIGFVILLCFCLMPINAFAENTQNKIVIDAGHGGVDGGAVALDGTLEKDINLQFSLIAVDLFKILGYNVVTTRTDDRSIHNSYAETIRQKKVSDIHNRLKMINESDAFALVSFHQNKYEQSKYRGTQVFYGGKCEKSKSLAVSVQNSVKTLLQPENTREVKKSDKSIYLLYHCEKPIIMVECGFVSNADELQMLKDREYQKKLCMAVVCGVVADDGFNGKG